MSAIFARHVVSLFCLTALSCGPSCGAQDIQGSHITGNAPAAGQFDEFLKRDLTAYFASRGMAKPQVTYKFLRIGPTQSGVAYPKYYVWASAVSERGEKLAGAVRVAAIERLRFEVTHFVSRAEILANPDQLASIFPAALLSTIRSAAVPPP